MTFGGMWACQWRELRPIVFGAANNNNFTATQSQNTVDDNSSDVGGFSIGRGRGRNRQGVDEYEMVGMKESAEPV